MSDNAMHTDPGRRDRDSRETWLGSGRRVLRAFASVLPVVFGMLLLTSLVTTLLPPGSLARLFGNGDVVDVSVGAIVGSLAAGNPIAGYILGGELRERRRPERRLEDGVEQIGRDGGECLEGRAGPADGHLPQSSASFAPGAFPARRPGAGAWGRRPGGPSGPAARATVRREAPRGPKIGPSECRKMSAAPQSICLRSTVGMS